MIDQFILKSDAQLINTVKNQNTAKLIGFKLTSTTSESEIKAKVDKLMTDAKCDFVVQNDWNQMKTGKHIFNFYSKNEVNKNLTIDDLSMQLMTVMETQRNSL